MEMRSFSYFLNLVPSKLRNEICKPFNSSGGIVKEYSFSTLHSGEYQGAYKVSNMLYEFIYLFLVHLLIIICVNLHIDFERAFGQVWP